MGVTKRWLLVVGAALLAVPAVARAQGVTVFAAASLTESLTEIAADWVRAGHPAPKQSFASSSTLARQIEAGAPANLFASADEQWMNELDGKGLLAPGTRVNLLSNQLVLIVPKDRPLQVTLDDKTDWNAVLGATGRLSVGDPAHVPAGLYAKAALTKLGAWATLQGRLAAGEDVRAAMRLVEVGEAPAGIVYATDAAASDKVLVAGVFPPSSYGRIVYPFALIKGADTAEAKGLLAFMSGPEARAVFAKRGFTGAE